MTALTVLCVARRRGRVAASTPMEELVDPSYKLDTVSAEKRDVMYIQARAQALYKYIYTYMCIYIYVYT